jgi:hypothetical protein
VCVVGSLVVFEVDGVGVGDGCLCGFGCCSEMREYAMQALVVSVTHTSTSALGVGAWGGV